MGRPLGAALFFCLTLSPAVAGTLQVVGPEGAVLVAEDVPEDAEWCLSWNHSVTGGPVKDCFVNRDGHMVLDRSYLHDFAAGLGEVLGRGHIDAAKGGGYWIRDMDERIDGDTLPLRVGKPRVDHRLRVGDRIHDLSALAAGQRVVLKLTE